MGDELFTIIIYRPASNGLVERFHRRLKDSLIFRSRVESYLEFTKRLYELMLVSHDNATSLGYPPFTCLIGCSSHDPSETEPLNFLYQPRSYLTRLHRGHARAKAQPLKHGWHRACRANRFRLVPFRRTNAIHQENPPQDSLAAKRLSFPFKYYAGGGNPFQDFNQGSFAPLTIHT